MSNMTKVYLLNAPLEKDYKHTLYFADKTAQYNHFYSLAPEQHKYTDFSYQRKEGFIRIPAQFDEVLKYNYVMYQNTAYSNKWFYAFITDIKFYNEDRTDIYIETDVIQTYMFECQFKNCFIEREHVNDDTVGKHTLPEQLETGEYICNNVIEDKSTQNTVFIVASAVDISSGKDSGLRLYGGVLNGWYYYYFNTVNEIQSVLGDISELRTNDAIISIFVMPRNYIHTIDGSNKVVESWDIPKYTMWDIDNETGSQEAIRKPTTVNGYTPKNNKLLTSPFSYLLIDNNSGATAKYDYELFNSTVNKDECAFKISGVITQGGSIRLMPFNYNGVKGANNHFGLTCGKFPICGWQSDYYTNWLTQNSLNLEVQTKSIQLATQQNIVNGVAGGIGSAITGDVGGWAQNMSNMGFAVENGLNQIKGITAQKEIHAFQSPTVNGSINCGDVLYTTGNIKFTAYQMSVKKEYAEIIDMFFNMFGYQVNRVGLPRKNHRKYYWYTKTAGCELNGNIPQNDIQKIKAIYDNGITYWKPNANMCDYSVNNDIV